MYWNRVKQIQNKLLDTPLDEETRESLKQIFAFYNRVHDICWQIESEDMSKEEIQARLRALRTNNPLELFM